MRGSTHRNFILDMFHLNNIKEHIFYCVSYLTFYLDLCIYFKIVL